MKLTTFLALGIALVGQLLTSTVSLAASKAVAQFTAHQVDPVILSPRSTVILGHSDITSPVPFAFDGVLVRPTGPAHVFNEVIIQDGDGKILGSSNVQNAEGKFVVKFSHPFPIFSNTQTDVVVLGRTKDDLWFANTQMAGLQTDQFFYNGTVVEVQGQYPGGQLRIDASVFQRGRVVLNRETLLQNRVIFNPLIRGLHTVDRFIAHVEYEGVEVWPSVEIVTTGKANPKNIRVALSYGAGKVVYGVAKFTTDKNRARIIFAKPLDLPIGRNSIELKVRLGGTFKHKRSAVFLLNTDAMQAMGNQSGYPIRVLSDLSPASNTVASAEVIYSR